MVLHVRGGVLTCKTSDDRAVPPQETSQEVRSSTGHQLLLGYAKLPWKFLYLVPMTHGKNMALVFSATTFEGLTPANKKEKGNNPKVGSVSWRTDIGGFLLVSL